MLAVEDRDTFGRDRACDLWVLMGGLLDGGLLAAAWPAAIDEGERDVDLITLPGTRSTFRGACAVDSWISANAFCAGADTGLRTDGLGAAPVGLVASGLVPCTLGFLAKAAVAPKRAALRDAEAALLCVEC